MIVKIAEEQKHCGLIYVGAFYTPDFTKLLCIDGIHPNRDGHLVIARKSSTLLKAVMSSC